ncbi:MAG: DUF2142 domain-containing protein, partial [Proteobacteria bacterium]|nr:DUF2142 domain-containing protein [Pseudomonadota bacterium]
MLTAGWRILSGMLQAWLAFGAEKTFLLFATIGGLCYLSQVSNLTHYPHGQQSFFHVAHLVYSLKGQPDTLPESFFTLVYENAPNRIRIARHNESKMGNCVIKYQDTGRCVRNPSAEPVSTERLMRIPLRPDITVPFTTNSHSAQYSPIGYATFMLGAGLAIWLEWPPLAIMYAAVASNLLASIALGYYALRLLPVLRWPMCFLMLTPAAFMIRCVIMPDSMLFALSLLALALALRLSGQLLPLTVRQRAGILGVSVLICVWKTAYVAMPLIFSVIPQRAFGGRTRKIAFLALVMALCVGSSLLWGVSVLSDNKIQEDSEMLDMVMQKTGSLFSAQTPGAIYYRLFTGEWLRYFLGGFFAWMPFWVERWPEIACVMIPLFLLLGLRPPNEPIIRWTLFQRALSIGIFIATLALIFAAIHLLHDNFSWLKNNWKNIQGRHLLPALPFLL